VVRVLDGRVRLRIEVAPRGGAQADCVSGGLRLRCGSRPELELHLSSTATLDGLRTVREFISGDYFTVVLQWRRVAYQQPISPDALLHATLDAWRSC
jgi:alpha,alpha-trehalase